MAHANEYSYEIITNEDDARRAARLIAEVFTTSNAITVFDRVTSEFFYDACAWPIMADAWQENNCILVRHCQTGEIVAATTAEDAYVEHKNKLLSTTENLIPVNDLLDEMSELFISRDFGQELKPNMVLHIGLSAVSLQHSGKGIAYQMGQFLYDRAKEQGFEYLIVQTTNSATRHIYLNKLKGKEVTIIDPKTWIWKKSKNEELTYPYKDFQGDVIPSILIKL